MVGELTFACYGGVVVGRVLGLELVLVLVMVGDNKVLLIDRRNQQLLAARTILSGVTKTAGRRTLDLMAMEESSVGREVGRLPAMIYQGLQQ